MSNKVHKPLIRPPWFWSVSVGIILMAVLVTVINHTNTQAAKFEIPTSPLTEVQEAGTVVLSNESQTVNGIEIQISNVRVSKQFVAAEVCLQLPNAADWGMEDIRLTSGEITITDYKYCCGEQRSSPDGNKVFRCDDLLIPIEPKMDLSEFTITIGRLATSVPEQPDCDKVQEKLDQAQSGITIKCIHEDYYFGYEILTKPEAMSEQDARKVAELAFSENVFGPWVFTVKP